MSDETDPKREALMSLHEHLEGLEREFRGFSIASREWSSFLDGDPSDEELRSAIRERLDMLAPAVSGDEILSSEKFKRDVLSGIPWDDEESDHGESGANAQPVAEPFERYDGPPMFQ